jgi:hypothetical protein
MQYYCYVIIAWEIIARNPSIYKESTLTRLRGFNDILYYCNCGGKYDAGNRLKRGYICYGVLSTIRLRNVEAA